ncbi:hypothetical protein WDW86_00550 [Bdellovibrionota bacterium FG-2]
MILLAASAGLVGLMHTLAPSHWLPVVLMVKARKWGVARAVLGALVAASGHLLTSMGLALVAIKIGFELMPGFEEEIEHYGGAGLIVFGISYAIFTYFRHSQCHGHSHHGPDPEGDSRSGDSRAFLFLFTLGLSPCLAVFPVFAAASGRGTLALTSTLVAFSFGVLTTLISATVLVSRGFMAFDHPLIEHYGEVIAGLVIALMGVFVFLFPSLF